MDQVEILPKFTQDTGDIRSSRHTILASGSVQVENSSLAADNPIGDGYSPDTQVVLPYFGAFSWQVAGSERLIDANAVLFVTGGEEFFESHPIANRGHGSVILTPSAEMLDEVSVDKSCLAAVTRPMSDSARLTMHALLFKPDLEPLAREELAIGMLSDLLADEPRNAFPVRSIVERAKEVLHCHAHEVLSLDFVSEAVGVTPIHLTQVFSKYEGMPLYRYQTKLRLSRALLELPTCSSLTNLALDLGFSSHSHFSTMFKSAFGISPSVFRAGHGASRLRNAARGADGRRRRER